MASFAHLLKVIDIAVIAQDLVLVEGELSFRAQRFAAQIAHEAHFVPMPIVCSRHVLAVGSNLAVTEITFVCKSAIKAV